MPNTVCNYSEARRKLKSLMDQAVDDRTPITITRKSGEPVVPGGSIGIQRNGRNFASPPHSGPTPHDCSNLWLKLRRIP